MKLELSSADYCPAELHEQLPIVFDVLRQMSGSDRPDYFLASASPAIQWNDKGETKEIENVVLCARYVGAKIEPGVQNLAIGLAFVTDKSLLRDENLDFSKVYYSAIGIVSDIGTQK